MDTEDVSARHAGLDTWPTAELASAILDAQLAAAAVARVAAPELAAAAEAAAERLSGPEGRLVYVGAGASGRLAVQDGVELLPTYGWPLERLVYLMAGGEAALIASIEGAEDDAGGAAAKTEALALGPHDVMIAVAASGRTPWAVSAASAASRTGALVIGIANNAGAPLLEASDHAIALPTGGEVIAGSTRMAAGTAQKIALNVLSTAIMVRLNRTHGNLMVALASTNAKLDARRVAILRRIVPVGADAAAEALGATGQDIRKAALVLQGCSPDEAAALLERSKHNLRAALAAIDDTG